MDREAQRSLHDLAWDYIDKEDFVQAEQPLRQLLDGLDPDDFIRIWEIAGLLANVLNSLSRPDEATVLYRQALSSARQAGDGHAAVGVAQYFLANQYLCYGDPRDALAETDPVPPDAGHVQCLLHSVAAQALWKLGQREDAQAAAQRALAAAPTEERIADMHRDLADILMVNQEDT